MAYEQENLRRGHWLEEEDERLTAIVRILGECHWDALAKQSGLRRSGKSCRLRWMNYLRPNLKHGEITEEEEHIILQLHKQWGNKWARIAQRLPGRTDNEIKNYWRSHLRKKALAKEQECFGGAIIDLKQDLSLPKCDSTVVLNTSINVGDCMYDISGASSSGDSSYAFELSNMSFGNSPYESRVSDWISCWSHEQSEAKHDNDCCGLYSCLCYPVGWNSKESGTNVWDYSSSIWGMD